MHEEIREAIQQQQTTQDKYERKYGRKYERTRGAGPVLVLSYFLELSYFSRTLF